MMNRVEFNEEMMLQVNGGTFTWNKYPEWLYNSVGIETNYHFFDKDEFTLPDGTKTDEKGANKWIDDVWGDDIHWIY